MAGTAIQSYKFSIENKRFTLVFSVKVVFLLHIYLHSCPAFVQRVVVPFPAPCCLLRCSTSSRRKQRSMTSCVRMLGGLIVYDLKFRTRVSERKWGLVFSNFPCKRFSRVTEPNFLIIIRQYTMHHGITTQVSIS